MHSNIILCAAALASLMPAAGAASDRQDARPQARPGGSANVQPGRGFACIQPGGWRLVNGLAVCGAAALPPPPPTAPPRAVTVALLPGVEYTVQITAAGDVAAAGGPVGYESCTLTAGHAASCWGTAAAAYVGYIDRREYFDPEFSIYLVPPPAPLLVSVELAADELRWWGVQFIECQPLRFGSSTLTTASGALRLADLQAAPAGARISVPRSDFPLRAYGVLQCDGPGGHS